MNRWNCEYPNCERSVTGTGGAIGLRAIGWYFERGVSMDGPTIRCPTHRPDGVQCRDDPEEKSCPFCAADAEAERWQALLREGNTP